MSRYFYRLKATYARNGAKINITQNGKVVGHFIERNELIQDDTCSLDKYVRNGVLAKLIENEDGDIVHCPLTGNVPSKKVENTNRYATISTGIPNYSVKNASEFSEEQFKDPLLNLSYKSDITLTTANMHSIAQQNESVIDESMPSPNEIAQMSAVAMNGNMDSIPSIVGKKMYVANENGDKLSEGEPFIKTISMIPVPSFATGETFSEFPTEDQLWSKNTWIKEAGLRNILLTEDEKRIPKTQLISLIKSRS